MAKLRSPNYPNRDLEAALGLAQVIYDKDGRNKVSRSVIAEHLGHEGLSGPALGKIGAIRAYGLIEGSGDELRVSEDAIAALMAPLGSDARREAISRLALNPVLFQDIRREFKGRVSVEALTYWLIQNGFSKNSAPIAARTYFKTMEFAGDMQSDNDASVSITSDQPRRPPPIRFAGGGEGVPVANHRYGAAESERAQAVGDEGAPFRITMDGKKLHIVADVDLDSLQTLKQVLESYETVLTLLRQPAGRATKPEWADKVFSAGDSVPADGTYNLSHKEHTGEHTIELAKGTKFPPCGVCGGGGAYSYRA